MLKWLTGKFAYDRVMVSTCGSTLGVCASKKEETVRVVQTVNILYIYNTVKIIEGNYTPVL